ncbi:hypothetical protein WDW37_01070 [Bdellovibrionota bacterium FG-1]
MKLQVVSINQRKKTLDIGTEKGVLSLPFSRLPLKPSARDKITAAYVDSELARRAVRIKIQICNRGRL